MILTERKKFFGAFILSGIIIGSISMMRGSHEYSSAMNAEPNKQIQQAGQALFVLGWIALGYYFSLGTEGMRLESTQKTLWIFGSILLILVAMMMIEVQGVSGSTKQGMDALFSIGIFSLALAITINKGTESKITAFLGAGLVVGAYFMLPYQASTCTVHGFGMPMLTGGFAMLSFVNGRAW